VRITLIAVGKLKERYWREATEEYLKRLSAYATVRVVEITDRDPARGEARAMAEEAVDVLRAVPEGSHVIALDLSGKQLSSESFSARLDALALDGRSAVTFVIGGSTGLDALVIARADEKLSLGPMTLPHNLARVVVLEQVYRAFRISRGEPYHK
jgi:23S rRNA (pseudouridine1915-N3)-methyltransferase